MELGLGPKTFLGLPNIDYNFCFVSMCFYSSFILFWVGGWISLEYSHLSPHLKLGFGLGLSLAINCDIELTKYDREGGVGEGSAKCI